MKISNIKQTSNNKYSIEIDNKKHIIYDDVLLELNLLRPRDITEEEYQTLLEKNKYYDAYNKIIKFITSKLRTEKEIDDKLKKLEIVKASRDIIIDRLKSEGYINEEQYIKAFINDQLLLTYNGPKKIYVALRKLNLNADLINNYLMQVPEETWEARARKLIDKKVNGSIKDSSKNFINKLKVYLNNLGYIESYYRIYLSSINIDDSESLKKDYQKYQLKLSRKYQGEELEFKLKQKLYSLGYRNSDIESLHEKTD